MTVPYDLGINTWLGMTFSLAALDKLEGMESDESVLGTKPYLHGLAYSATVGMGIAGICYKLAPDWMLMYYGDHDKIPPAIETAMFGLYPAMYTLGFLLTQQLERKKKGLGWVIWAANLAGVLGLMLATRKRVLKVGTTEEYEKGEARSIVKTSLAPILAVGMPSAVPALYYFAKRAAQ
jgi:drug/metabolite transporter (DMT)-like permease